MLNMLLKTVFNSTLKKEIFSHGRILPYFFSRGISHERFVAEKQNEKLTSSYISGPAEVPLLGLTLGQVLQRAADKFGDQTSTVFVQQNIRKSFHELLQDADQVAAAFMSLGLKQGDRIGIWGSNSYEWLLTQWAAARAGLILVNINPAYRASELRHALNLAGVKVLVMGEKFRHLSLADALNGLIQAQDSSGSVGDDPIISTPVIPTLERVVVISDQHIVPKSIRWTDLLTRATPTLISKVHNMQRLIQFDDPVNIQFTSGTTGNPKGATLSHHNLVNTGYIASIRVGYHEMTHRLCLPLPLYHGFACAGVITGGVHGACVVFPGPTYNGQETVNAIQNEKCTILYGAPTMFVDIVHLPNLKDYDLSSLTTILMGGAPCPLELAKMATAKLGLKHTLLGYGMTETSANSFMVKRTDSLETACSTVGYVSDHFEIKIVDPVTRHVVPINTPGEICARGYGVMLSYWNQPDKTAETITKEGWIQTGDIGVLTEDGYGKIVGRIKDMIIRGGENIYPREIEELLHTHPEIQEAHVVGVPDARMGEELCAWVRRKPESKISQDDLKAFCKDKISYFKVPRYWLFKDAFPITVTGKVQKFVMRDISIKELNIQS